MKTSKKIKPKVPPMVKGNVPKAVTMEFKSPRSGKQKVGDALGGERRKFSNKFKKKGKV